MMLHIDARRKELGVSKKFMAGVMGISYKHYRVLLRGEARLRVGDEGRALVYLGEALEIVKK